MPSTSYNVTMIKAAVENYSRQQILDALNEICLIIFQDNTMRVEKIDTATGMPPLITTVAGIRNYTCTADCRETAAIFCQSPKTYLPTEQKGNYTEYKWHGTMYYKIPVRQVSASLNVNASLIFVDDPGTTTDKYYHQYYTRHVTITSESIQLVFPEEVHYLIRNAVIQMLKGENYSSGLGDVDPIKKIVSIIKNKLNKGAQPRSYRTPVRTEDMDDDFSGCY